MENPVMDNAQATKAQMLYDVLREHHGAPVFRGAVECADIRRNTDGEGRSLGHN